MKKILLLVIIIWTNIVLGQNQNGTYNLIKNNKFEIDTSLKVDNEQVQNYIKSQNIVKDVIIDTSLKVVFADTLKELNNDAIFINNKYVNTTAYALSLNTDLIESINLIKKDIKIDSILYKKQFRITTKNNYTPKLISLQKVKEKYTNYKDKSVLFMIDGDLIRSDYNNSLIDENYILRVFIDRIIIDKDRIDLGLIKILTKSKKNIQDLKEQSTIKIR